MTSGALGAFNLSFPFSAQLRGPHAESASGAVRFSIDFVSKAPLHGKQSSSIDIGAPGAQPHPWQA